MACGTPSALKLRVAVGTDSREVEVPPGSSLKDVQRTAKRAFPALRDAARPRTLDCCALLLLFAALTAAGSVPGQENILLHGVAGHGTGADTGRPRPRRTSCSQTLTARWPAMRTCSASPAAATCGLSTGARACRKRLPRCLSGLAGGAAGVPAPPVAQPEPRCPRACRSASVSSRTRRRSPWRAPVGPFTRLAAWPPSLLAASWHRLAAPAARRTDPERALPQAGDYEYFAAQARPACCRARLPPPAGRGLPGPSAESRGVQRALSGAPRACRCGGPAYCLGVQRAPSGAPRAWRAGPLAVPVRARGAGGQRAARDQGQPGRAADRDHARQRGRRRRAARGAHHRLGQRLRHEHARAQRLGRYEPRHGRPRPGARARRRRGRWPGGRALPHQRPVVLWGTRRARRTLPALGLVSLPGPSPGCRAPGR